MQPFPPIQAQRDKVLRTQQAEQEERLAAELSRIKNEELRDEKMRQHVRETSLELRELEAKLKAAYTNMERHAQVAEKEAVKYDKMVAAPQILNFILLCYHLNSKTFLLLSSSTTSLFAILFFIFRSCLSASYFADCRHSVCCL